MPEPLITERVDFRMSSEVFPMGKQIVSRPNRRDLRLKRRNLRWITRHASSLPGVCPGIANGRVATFRRGRIDCVRARSDSRKEQTLSMLRRLQYSRVHASIFAGLSLIAPLSCRVIRRPSSSVYINSASPMIRVSWVEKINVMPNSSRMAFINRRIIYAVS